jgi:hypothetical protein
MLGGRAVFLRYGSGQWNEISFSRGEGSGGHRNDRSSKASAAMVQGGGGGG